jgi:hypothetical protein
LFGSRKGQWCAFWQSRVPATLGTVLPDRADPKNIARVSRGFLTRLTSRAAEGEAGATALAEVLVGKTPLDGRPVDVTDALAHWLFLSLGKCGVAGNHN